METKNLYDHYYDHGRFDIPAVTAQSLDNLAESFHSFKRSGRILDIGFGAGGVLSAAEKRGWQCYGTEVSPAALEHGKRHGWIVTEEPEADSRFIPGGFDVVTLFEVLEHVGDPDSLLGMAARYLRPGGLLYLTTPNARSMNRRVLHLKWSVFSPPEHIVLWTARGVRHALSRSGFCCPRIRTEGFNPSEILSGFRRPATTIQGRSRNEAGQRLNEVMSRGRGRRVIKSGVNRCLSFFGIGDSLKVWAIRDRSN
jgi:SAM-dependent methyltransferase